MFMTRVFLFYMLVTKVVAASITQNWTVQRQDEYGFSSVVCDQTIEQTLNVGENFYKYLIYIQYISMRAKWVFICVLFFVEIQK